MGVAGFWYTFSNDGTKVINILLWATVLMGEMVLVSNIYRNGKLCIPNSKRVQMDTVLESLILKVVKSLPLNI